MRARTLPEYKIKHWTKEEEDMIVKLRKEGCKFKEISECVHRSPEAIRIRMNKMGLSGKGYLIWKDEDIERLKEMKRQGKTWKEISRELKRTKASCENKYNRVREPNSEPDPIPDITQYFEEGDEMGGLVYIKTIERNGMHIFKHKDGYIETFTDAQLI